MIEEFLDSRNNECKHEWMRSWDYQEERIKNIRYPDNYPATFDTFDGIEDIEKWINWISKSEFKDDIDNEEIEPLIDFSYSFDSQMLKLDRKRYYSTIGRYNAEDWIYHNRLNWGNRVLDFGPGYGRQINLLSQLEDNLVYVGVDAILQSYCMQNVYYSYTGYEVNEYLENKDLKISDSGIYHIPTWRCDLLPKKYFDKVLCVQVLQEVNEDLVRHVLDIFSKVLKKDGILYIRDHGKNWKYSSHKLDIEKMLPDYGFDLEYRCDLEDRTQIHGVTRIWKKS